MSDRTDNVVHLPPVELTGPSVVAFIQFVVELVYDLGLLGDRQQLLKVGLSLNRTLEDVRAHSPPFGALSQSDSELLLELVHSFQWALRDKNLDTIEDSQ